MGTIAYARDDANTVDAYYSLLDAAVKLRRRDQATSPHDFGSISGTRERFLDHAHNVVDLDLCIG